MFGMNRFHVSASGAIQGHHGPVVAFSRDENIAKKGENVGYQHFSPFPTMFSKGFFFQSH